MRWSDHLRLLLGTFAGAIVGLTLFILAMNPYGNLPNTVLPQHLMMDDNQRYQYPSVVRSGRYDGLIIGTSTSRLLDPRPFEALLGGRIANVAMNAGTAWEQTELTRLFLRHTPRPGTLVVGIDWVWCSQTAERERITFRGFPEWMYDDNPWNDLAYMLNTRALEIAGRRAGAALLGLDARLPDNGWEIFTPPEGAFDIERVREKIYGNGPRQAPAVKVPADVPTAEQRASWKFPALAWIESLIADGGWRRTLLLLPPVHVRAQPQPGSIAAAEEEACKAQIARIGARHRAPVIDFRISSSITTRDENFWDPLHYRVGIAERVAAGVAQALATGRSDPGGDWKVLNAP